ncbi:MAG: thioredoxin fold domain-containing protein [Gammaproteobacteria bacterium]
MVPQRRQNRRLRRVLRLPLPAALALGLCLLAAFGPVGAAGQSGKLQFDDQRLSEDIVLPDWFKLSFLDLRDDLDEAIAAGKRGLIVYFGQKDCPYCKAHLENNWGNKDIVAYTRKYFDVVAIDVRGQRLVTDMDGIVSTEKALAIREKTNFTPSIVFYNKDAREVLRLSGYHPIAARAFATIWRVPSWRPATVRTSSTTRSFSPSRPITSIAVGFVPSSRWRSFSSSATAMPATCCTVECSNARRSKSCCAASRPCSWTCGPIRRS